MATTKLWNVKSRVDNAVNYIMNKDKTKINITIMRLINMRQ